MKDRTGRTRTTGAAPQSPMMRARKRPRLRQEGGRDHLASPSHHQHRRTRPPAPRALLTVPRGSRAAALPPPSRPPLLAARAAGYASPPPRTLRVVRPRCHGGCGVGRAGGAWLRWFGWKRGSRGCGRSISSRTGNPGGMGCASWHWARAACTAASPVLPRLRDGGCSRPKRRALLSPSVLPEGLRKASSRFPEGPG